MSVFNGKKTTNVHHHAPKAPATEAPKVNHERFFRIVEHPLKPGDTFRGYQPELIEVADGMVIERKLINKPDMFEYAQSHMIDLMDPRNHAEV